MKTEGSLVKLRQDRLQLLIDGLKTEAGQKMFDMGLWAHKPQGAKEPRDAYGAGGDCGTTCCIAGLAAILDPEFFNFCPDDNPIDVEYDILYDSNGDYCSGSAGFAKWLGISNREADLITTPWLDLWHNWQTDDNKHAIDILEAFKSGGIEAALQLNEAL